MMTSPRPNSDGGGVKAWEVTRTQTPSPLSEVKYITPTAQWDRSHQASKATSLVRCWLREVLFFVGCPVIARPPRAEAIAQPLTTQRCLRVRAYTGVCVYVVSKLCIFARPAYSASRRQHLPPGFARPYRSRAGHTAVWRSQHIVKSRSYRYRSRSYSIYRCY